MIVKKDPPYKTLPNGNLLFVDNQGVNYVVPPEQYTGRMAGARPSVYLPEGMSTEQRGRNFEHLMNHLQAMKEWDDGGRQTPQPYRFEYSMRPRSQKAPELDMSLRSTLSAEDMGPKMKPQLIMKANPQMRTGQEPSYYKVWDDNRKQWTTRPVEPEELNYYRQKNRRQ